MALRKYDPDAYMIYHICHICVDICMRIRNKKCGYGRMVKFLFAKEKMRVRFPLSAHDEVMYCDKKLGIVELTTITMVVSIIVPYFPFLTSTSYPKN